MQNFLIVDNDYKNIQNIFNNINTNPSLKIIGICDSEKDAIKYILKENIDIIILELDFPNIKRLFDKLEKNNTGVKIIAISNKHDSIVNILNNNIDIYHFFIKPINVNKLIDTLNNITESTQKIENTLVNLLNDFNFNKNTKGYSYILICLKYCIENNYTSILSIKSLYKEIELKYNKTISSSKLEWNIAKAIHSMVNYTDETILNEFAPYNISPSPKVFINGVLNLYYNKKSNNSLEII